MFAINYHEMKIMMKIILKIVLRYVEMSVVGQSDSCHEELYFKYLWFIGVRYQATPTVNDLPHTK